MNVLFFTPYFWPYIGGIERFVDEISQRIVHNPEIDKVSIITTNSLYKNGTQKIYKKFTQDNGIDIYRLNFLPRNIPGIYHSYNGGFFSIELGKILRKINPDIVHFCKFEWFVPNYILCKCLQNYKTTKVFFISYHPKNISFKHLPMLYFNRMIFQKIDYIHVPSKSTKKAIQELIKFPDERIKIIPLGVNINKIIKIKHKGINILNIGRFNERKGQIRLIKSFLTLPKKLFERCNLILIGHDDGCLQEAKKLTKQHNNISIYEDIDDKQLKNFYQTSDIFATMSLDEAFGLVYFEAMSYSLPVIAYKTAGIKNSLENDPTIGLFLPIEKEKMFHRELIKLITDESYRNHIGENGYRFIKENINWDITTKKILDLYSF